MKVRVRRRISKSFLMLVKIVSLHLGITVLVKITNTFLITIIADTIVVLLNNFH